MRVILDLWLVFRIGLRWFVIIGLFFVVGRFLVRFVRDS